jgi:hypothetical protein
LLPNSIKNRLLPFCGKSQFLSIKHIFFVCLSITIGARHIVVIAIPSVYIVITIYSAIYKLGKNISSVR